MSETDPAVVVVREQTIDHFRTWPPAGWVRDREAGDLSIPARRLAIIAHTAHGGTADVEMLVDVARCYSIGSVYAHDAVGRATTASRHSCCRSASASVGCGLDLGCPAGSSPCRSVRVPRCSPGCAPAARWRSRGCERQHDATVDTFRTSPTDVDGIPAGQHVGRNADGQRPLEAHAAPGTDTTALTAASEWIIVEPHRQGH